MTPSPADLLDRLTALQEELSEQSGRADLAELAGPLMHEFNNYLNTVALQFLILESQVPKNLARDLAALRRQGEQVAGLIRRWHEWGRAPVIRRPVDLNHIVREAVDTLTREQQMGYDTPLVLELADDLPAVAASACDVARLCRFLFRNPIASRSSSIAKALVRTRCFAADSVQLRLERPGLEGEPKSPARLHESVAHAEEPTNSLEWAACKRLVQRLQGKIDVQNDSGKGLLVIVELPALLRNKRN